VSNNTRKLEIHLEVFKILRGRNTKKRESGPGII
jgi:hypothetical protein